MPQLTIRKAGAFHREHALPDTDIVLIGRARACDVHLPDANQRVSRYHAAIVRVPGPVPQYFLRDLGSLRSTRVAGKPVQQRMLLDTDLIEIVHYELTFRVQAAAHSGARRLRVVCREDDPSGLEKSTVAFFSSRALNDLSLSDERRAAIIELLPVTKESGSRSALLSARMQPVLRILRADRGFVGLFNGEKALDFHEAGVCGLGPEEAIEIRGDDSLAKIRGGQTVHDGRTLMVPIATRDATVGFFCVNRFGPAPVFSTDDERFLLALGRMLAERPEPVQNVTEKDNDDPPFEWALDFVGKHPAIVRLREEIRDVAHSGLHVLLNGETGTGKEVTARAIHRESRAGRPFVSRNCATISESLAETEIFGYVPRSGIAGADPKGAPGWFEQANGGTLFLDEIHALRPTIQDKFLRVLEEGQVWRVHARAPVRVDVKVIAATDRRVDVLIADGEFRRPLFHRFGSCIEICPLRERAEDVILLAFFFIDKFAARSSRTRTISRKALQILTDYRWPGNVRELEHCIQQLVDRNREVIFSWDLPAKMRAQMDEKDDEPQSMALSDSEARAAADQVQTIEEVEKEKILETLETTRGNITKAGRLLGYRSRQTMLNKMERYDIPRDYGDPEPAQRPSKGRI